MKRIVRFIRRSPMAFSLATVVLAVGTFAGVRLVEFSRYHHLKQVVAERYEEVHSQGAALLDSVKEASRSLPADTPEEEALLAKAALASVQVCTLARSDPELLDELTGMVQGQSEPERVGANAICLASVARGSDDPGVWQCAEKALTRAFRLMVTLDERMVAKGESPEAIELESELASLEGALNAAVDGLPEEKVGPWIGEWWEEAGQVANAVVQADSRGVLFNAAAAVTPERAVPLVGKLLENTRAVGEARLRGHLLGVMRNAISGSEKLKGGVKEDLDGVAREWAAACTLPEQSGDLLRAYHDACTSDADIEARKQTLGAVEGYYGRIGGKASRSWAITGLAISWVGVDNDKAFRLLSDHLGGLREPANLVWDINYGNRLLDYFAALAATDASLASKQYGSVSKPGQSTKAMAACGMLKGLPGGEWQQVNALLQDGTSDAVWADLARRFAAVILLSGEQVDQGLAVLQQMRGAADRESAVLAATSVLGSEHVRRIGPLVASLPPKDRRIAVANLALGLPYEEAWKIVAEVFPAPESAALIKAVFGPSCFQASSQVGAVPDANKRKPAEAEKVLARIQEPEERSFVAAMLVENVALHDPELAIVWVRERITDPFWKCIAGRFVVASLLQRAQERWNWSTASEKEDSLLYVLLHGLGRSARKRLGERHILDLAREPRSRPAGPRRGTKSLEPFPTARP